MDDDKIRDILGRFNPQLSSSERFMSELSRNLESVEMIKRHAAEVRRRSRRAVVSAAVVGLITGMILMWLMPYLQGAVMKVQGAMPSIAGLNVIIDHYMLISWIVTALVCVVVSLNVYELSLSVSKRS
ncbi:MAG: hypothetical protein K2H86_05300 [Muribaculaceae bacterium]|nr:hypothetical protein [Muribaculaceae bacterium]